MKEVEKTYKFYHFKDNPSGSDYCFCERPCTDNMSLYCFLTNDEFLSNGEVCGFMSESLVYENKNIKEISLLDFACNFITPLIAKQLGKKDVDLVIEGLRSIRGDYEGMLSFYDDEYANTDEEEQIYKEKLKSIDHLIKRLSE